jgi:hypothetical protein
MVNSDLLRSKSIHAEVAYLRELKRVAQAKQIEAQQGLALRDKEQRFWREAVALKSIKRPPDSTTPVEPIRHKTNLEASAQVERMRFAHSKLKEATRSYSAANTDLRSGMEALSNSQKKLDLIQGLIQKATRLRANQLEARLADEVVDLVNGSRAVRLNIDQSRPKKTETPFNEGSKVDKEPFKDPLPSQVPQGSIQTFISTQAPSGANSRICAGSAINTSSALPTFGLSDLACKSSAGEASLSLKCSFGAGAAVGLSLSKSEGGAIKVLIDPSSCSFSTSLLRDRASITNRLQNLGLKVNAIEIGSVEPSLEQSQIKMRKRHSGEEDYENTIS